MSYSRDEAELELERAIADALELVMLCGARVLLDSRAVRAVLTAKQRRQAKQELTRDLERYVCERVERARAEVSAHVEKRSRPQSKRARKHAAPETGSRRELERSSRRVDAGALRGADTRRRKVPLQ